MYRTLVKLLDVHSPSRLTFSLTSNRSVNCLPGGDKVQTTSTSCLKDFADPFHARALLSVSQSWDPFGREWFLALGRECTAQRYLRSKHWHYQEDHHGSVAPRSASTPLRLYPSWTPPSLRMLRVRLSGKDSSFPTYTSWTPPFRGSFRPKFRTRSSTSCATTLAHFARAR